jgi:beta-phosphoglucomutase-like phosphatase (HAD superfamily)
MIPRPLAAVVFDMDGLLLDTETLVRTAQFEAGEALGHPMSDAIFHRLIGKPKASGDAELMAHFGPHFPLEAFDEAWRRHFGQACSACMPLKPGARELLEWLDEARIPRALATSTGGAAARRHLDQAGILHFFTVLVTADDVARGKPDPEPYLTAAQRLDLSPLECLALEDSHNGIRSATSAGMTTIMVPDLMPARPEVAGLCAAVLPDLHEVRAAIQTSLG